MKTIITIACSFLLLSTIACSNNDGNEGHTVPQDSTNLHGTGPVQYGPDDPANPDSYNTSDTGIRANTGTLEDSMRAHNSGNNTVNQGTGR